MHHFMHSISDTFVFRLLIFVGWFSHLLKFMAFVGFHTPQQSKGHIETSKVGPSFFLWGGTQITLLLLMVQKTQTTTVWMFKHEINCQPQLVFLAGFLPSTVCMVDYFFPPFFTSEKWYGTRNCQLGYKIASWVDGTVCVMIYLGPGILYGTLLRMNVIRTKPMTPGQVLAQ